MIPQEKIEQAAGLYRDELLKEMRRTTGQFVGMPLTHKQIESQVEGYAIGMEAGVRFAETEMKPVSDMLIELAMRSKVAFPATEDQDRMFTEGLKNQTGFQERLFNVLEKITKQ